MIHEFEQRLVNVLGVNLSAPFNGNVIRAEGTPDTSTDPKMSVGVLQVEPLLQEMGGKRTEIVPGSDDFRQVLRLECVVGFSFFPNLTGGRAQALAGVEDTLYQLDHPEFKNGKQLIDPAVTDPGFLIRSMEINTSSIKLSEVITGTPRAELSATAKGLFWPVNAAGETGVAITEARVRGVNLSIKFTPAAPEVIAGGADVVLTVHVSATGPMRISDNPGALPFGSLVLKLFGPGNQPGQGTLTGGTAGVDNSRVVDLIDNQAKITYSPPAQPTREFLFIALDDGENGSGAQIGRFELNVRGV